MPRILVRQAFLFSPDGNHAVQIETGEQEVSDRCAIVAVDHLKVAAMAGEEPANDRSRTGKKPTAR